MEEISLSELASYFISKIILIIFITSAFLIGGVVNSLFVKVPLFKSETTLVLTHVAENSEAISQSDILLNRNLLSTYREIIVSRTVLNEVIDELELKYNENELASMVSVTSVRDTEVIKIAVSSTKAKEAKKISNLLADVFSEKVLDIYSIRNISIIDEAETASSPYNINFLKQTVMQFTLGLFASFSLVIIMFGLDNTIKSETEIERHLKLPVLGVVPAFREGEGEDVK